MKALIIAGGLPQIELIRQLHSRNIETVLLDGSEKAIARPFADKFICINVFDIDAVKRIAVDEKVDFLITVCADQVLLVVAQVSELLGLPCYVDYETARKASDKIEMKRMFLANGIPTSRHVELYDFNFTEIEKLKYPLVVKPVDAYSSKGVRKAVDRRELEQYYHEAEEISRSGGVIVEEYCAGEEISVDAFVVNGKAHVLCVSNSEKINDADRFVIFRGRYPVSATPAVLEQVQSVAQKIADAFELKNSPLLIQMINDGEHVSVLEFCTRTGGNMKYLLIKYSSGVDVIKATIDITLGLDPDVGIVGPYRNYVVNDFIYCKPGVFDHLEGFDELVAEGVLTEYHCIKPEGMVFSGVRSSSDRVAGVTICADSLEEFNRLHKRFVEKAKVVDKDGNDIMRHDLLPGLEG